MGATRLLATFQGGGFIVARHQLESRHIYKFDRVLALMLSFAFLVETVCLPSRALVSITGAEPYRSTQDHLSMRPAFHCPRLTAHAGRDPCECKARMQYPGFNRFLRSWLHPVMRQGEQSRFSGVFYYLLGVFIVRAPRRTTPCTACG